MRNKFDIKVERGRIRDGLFATTSNDPYGMFRIMGPCGSELKIVVSDGKDISPVWEHVSVSTMKRIPNWVEMNFVKELFWDDEELVIQFHPPKSEYINNNPRVLHLWKPIEFIIPLPPRICV